MDKVKALGISLLIASLSILTVIETTLANDMNIVSIKNIAQWDHLNIRKEASASSEIVGKIPSNGEGIVLLGKERQKGETAWVNIAWGSTTGWVNANYLNFLSTESVAWEKYMERASKDTAKKDSAKTETKKPAKSIKEQKEQYGTAAEFRAKISEYREKATAERALLAAKEIAKQAKKEHALSTSTQTAKNSNTATSTDDIVLKCGGVKPFWNIDLTEDDIQVNINKKRNELPITSRRKSSFFEKSVVIQGYGDHQENGVKLYLSKDNQCKDGITNIRYPYSVKAVLNGHKVYYGCCDAVK
jgi:uncharacterized membrane protein